MIDSAECTDIKYRSWNYNRVNFVIDTALCASLNNTQIHHNHNISGPMFCLPSSTSITPATSTFLTDTTRTPTTCSQQQPLRTIAKPIARRPTNAGNPSGPNGNIHNSTLLALATAAAAAVNSQSGRPANGGDGLTNNANDNNSSGGGVCISPTLGNPVISSSSASGN